MEVYHITPESNTDYRGRVFANDTTLSGLDIKHDPAVIGDVEQPSDESFLHSYKDPLVAAILFPAINWHDPDATTVPAHHLWACEPLGKIVDDGIIIHSKQLKVIKEVVMPEVALVQRQRFAITCAISSFNCVPFLEWANNWLNSIDRTEKTAQKMDEALDSLWGDEAFEAGKTVARCALTAVAGMRYAKQYQRPLEVCCGAAGWRLWSNSGGKTPLVPAARFGLMEKPSQTP